MRRISPSLDRSILRFSPSALSPVRSSPSSEMIGEPSLRDLNALPSAWTTPFLPLLSSYRQPRSRSMGAPAWRLKSPPDAGRETQFKLTRSSPRALPPCCLLSETVGAFLVRVTLLRLTPVPCGGCDAGRLV